MNMGYTPAVRKQIRILTLRYDGLSENFKK